ncbi:protein FAR1-RELATED SEQUENCE 5-like [Papaver somniferum]|uniref:protein FAR1-RELATED SEQUENCE 5-like n=1 Tax=Papaver somniferum TaxID=3469 RepID=UPI000E6FA809|nr:protein FAR1-RELATED SEQUENCE 5-like [Papaver somniferum]
MNTTQRSESINSFFDHYVNSKTSLREFVESCDQALERMYLREREEDYKSIHLKCIYVSQDLLVRHASKVYTRVIVNIVQVEFNASLRYRSKILEIDGDEHTYSVYWLIDDKTVEEFPVKIIVVTQKGTCGCQKFEFVGIPCKHLHHILVLRLYVTEIPQCFIMERWTKYANKCAVLGSNQSVIKDDKAGIEAMRISHYCRVSTELAYMFGKSEQAYAVAMDFHNQAMEKIKETDILELRKEHGKDMQVEESEVNDELLATGSSCTTVAEIPNAISFDDTLPNMIMGDPRIS